MSVEQPQKPVEKDDGVCVVPETPTSSEKDVMDEFDDVVADLVTEEEVKKGQREVIFFFFLLAWTLFSCLGMN